MYYQQGDVILKKIDSEIEGEKLNHLILAEGETTGHKHQIVEGLGQLIMVDKILHLQIFSKTAKLKHDDHQEITIPTGNYEVGIVKEYDHFEEETREIMD